MSSGTPVKSVGRVGVNRLSTHGLEVLRILAGTEGCKAEPWRYITARRAGCLEMRDLYAVLYTPDSSVSPSVARASLSRALRRFWALGFVELHQHPFPQSSDSLSARRQASRVRLAQTETNPEREYQEYRAWLGDLGDASFPDRYGSAAAFLDAKREQARRPDRGYYVRCVELTDAGWLTAKHATELTGAEDVTVPA